MKQYEGANVRRGYIQDPAGRSRVGAHKTQRENGQDLLDVAMRPWSATDDVGVRSAGQCLDRRGLGNRPERESPKRMEDRGGGVMNETKIDAASGFWRSTEAATTPGPKTPKGRTARTPSPQTSWLISCMRWPLRGMNCQQGSSTWPWCISRGAEGGRMSWVYIKSEPHLWTVGFYAPYGTWHTDSDHSTKDEAADRCAYLNGG